MNKNTKNTWEELNNLRMDPSFNNSLGQIADKISDNDDIS